MTISTTFTSHVDVSKLSLRGVEQLTERCEHLIYSHKAALEDYELYIKCQAELAKRDTDLQPGFAASGTAQFINS